MKKIAMLLGFLALIAAGCHSFHHHARAADKPLRIAASVFPVWLFASNICAGAKGVRLELLIPSSLGCPHDFALRPADMRGLSQADIFIINGAGLEDFLAKALESLSKRVIIDASEGVTKMPAAGHGGHEGHKHAGHDHGDIGGINPHTFACPANAEVMARNIAEGLAKADPANAELYRKNADGYCAALNELSDRFEEVGKNAKNRNIAIEHDALAYLARNARLQITDVFENSGSASAVARLAERLKKEGPALLAGDSQYSDKLLQTLSKESGIPCASLDPCAGGPENAPLDYYQNVMEKNLRVLEAHFD